MNKKINPEAIERNLSQQEQKEFKQMIDEHEILTGYKFDYEDLGWNEFVGRYSCAQIVCRDTLLKIFKGFATIVITCITVVFVFNFLGYPHYTSFLTNFAVEYRWLLGSYFSDLFLLYLIVMECFAPVGIAYFNMKEKISIPMVFYKTIKISSWKQQCMFLARTLLILGVVVTLKLILSI